MAESWIEPFRKEAERWIAEGRIGTIEFAGRTYQVEIFDPDGEEYWPFLQFGADEQVQDAFCTCEASERQGVCLHLAAALLRLYGAHDEPFHLRYQRSLWNRLCFLFGERLGYDAGRLLKLGSGHYVYRTVTHKQLFSVQARNETAILRLQTLIERRVPETEENSLKFSGLGLEELARWREGKPSLELQYELSFWSDLAKWAMLLQDAGAAYRIDFKFDEEGIPNELFASFEEIAFSFYLSRANLPLVIPGLATVNSPLKVYDAQAELVSAITYNREGGSLHLGEHKTALAERLLRRESLHQQEESSHPQIGNWLYVPPDGFYSREEHLLPDQVVIPAEKVGDFLDRHAQMVRRRLTGERIHLDSIDLQYQLFFSKDWTLHIAAYLFTPGDLQEGNSRLFGRWAYSNDDGFYRLNGVAFPQVVTVIPEAEVSDFLHRNRPFLNGRKGFETHLRPLEPALTYRVTPDNVLEFEGEKEEATSFQGHSFGDWVYRVDEGFFLASKRIARGALYPGTTVVDTDIPLFIRANREELELLGGFFSDKCPLSQISLELAIVSPDALLFRPHYELQRSYQRRDVKFFGHFTYVEGEGFCEIPPRLLLPERFHEETTLQGQELMLFLNYEFDKVRHLVTALDPRLKRPDSLKLIAEDAPPGRPAMRGSVELKLSYESEQGRVLLSEVWRARAQGRRYLFSAAGLLDLADARFDWLRGISPSRLAKAKGTLRLSFLELMRLMALEEVSCGRDSAGITALLGAFSTLEATETLDVAGLKSSLRPYQEAGLHWLFFLYSHGLSGLLCDDMGLGKTHQAMALMAAIQNLHRPSPAQERPHYLIVCPTSVLFHWKEKLAEFLPDLTVHLFHGPSRKLDEPDLYDVLLTSYGVLRGDVQQLQQIHFELALFDEIQLAKNAASRTHNALLKIRSYMRLGLTGTPIENRLQELKALFDLVLPSYLPAPAQFREKFTLPIEAGNSHATDLLRRIIRPFILRRKKEEVLSELPEKSEEISHCELSPEQRALYNEVLSRSREVVLRDLRDTSKPVAYTHVFSILTALKRVCDHPAVYHKEAHRYREYRSGKWELFCELLEQARASSQKVVVFSHYLEMLDIIELHLRDAGIGYASVRGSTVDRARELTRFANEASCEVFVGSLQAAGLGIDLTAGSVVIHYDRWWTKAREEQATDRVYRIGQRRGVQVFKLLTLGTFEERIAAMIERKGQLMEEVVGKDDAGQIKHFTRQELIELLSLSA